MLKKLSSLLFEETEEEIEEEVIEEPAPEPEPARRRRREPEPETKQAETKTTMQRIDVTQPLPAITGAPASGESVFRPAESEKQRPLGLTVDELEGAAAKPQPVQEPAKPAPAPVQKPSRQKKQGYDFQPVISPIFGVDETADTSAVQTAGNPRNSRKNDGNVSEVISPIYGVAKEEETAPVQTKQAVRPAPAAESVFAAPETKPEPVQEDDVPEFSLDDILRVRDEEYARDNRMVMQSLFPDLDGSDEDVPDETTIMSRNVTPFGNIGRNNE